MQKIRVGLFEDHPFTAKGLSDYLTANKMDVVFCCSDKAELINCLTAIEPDVLILDIVAPGISGLELFETIAANYPAVHLIAHTSLSSAMLVENLLSIGVKGFVNKKQNEADVLACINKVANNEISIPGEYHFLTSKYRVLQSNVLSAREIEILKLIATELTSQQIAEKLSLSTFTVENHRKSIFKKLEVKNLAGMIIVASRLGYIS